jgi:UDP-galactopyranose mutase
MNLVETSAPGPGLAKRRNSPGDAPRFLIVGAGISGAVLARVLAEAGGRCDVFEERTHVAGHCHTERDRETGVLVHRHGPHTLHSDSERVWEFLERFTAIHPYRHTKWACVGGELYPFPISLRTLSQFYGRPLGPDEARGLVAADAREAWPDDSRAPSDFEEAALSRIGRPLYEAFYRGYTIKQWGRDPRQLPASTFSRLPVRFDEDDNYFHHDRQGQPVGGFTAMVERMLDHENIAVHQGRSFSSRTAVAGYHHVFYSGAIDRYFDWKHGRLAYRTLRFDEERGRGTLQERAVINYCDAEVPFTRVTEHKHFSEWENPELTVRSFEYSSDCQPGDTPYYPLRLASDRNCLDAYIATAKATSGVSFIGRLGTYRYIDMDVAISEAMDVAAAAMLAWRQEQAIPTFFVDL